MSQAQYTGHCTNFSVVVVPSRSSGHRPDTTQHNSLVLITLRTSLGYFIIYAKFRH